ncbi:MULTISPECIES: hypothetical protein [unclassified Streptomyces]|uniref:hypothetical protein n=1 Tax=unclassified Streptomyces TaxID=2593676 RepID=UPI0035E313CE
MARSRIWPDFWHRAVEPALAEPAGLWRLRAVCVNSVGCLEAPLLPGGCPVPAALENGELPGGFDVDLALSEIVAAGPALNAARQLQHDRTAAGRAHRAIERALDQS